MNERLRQLLLEAFSETHYLWDIAVDDALAGNLPEGQTKCDYCAFYTGKDCESPWSPAEALQRNFSPCREGVEFAFSGIPLDELNQLFLDGKDIPVLTLHICPPDEHPEPAEAKAQDAEALAQLPFDLKGADTMKEITYGDLLDCYNTLLEYAGTNRLRIEKATQEEVDATDGACIVDAMRKVDAAREVIADFYFDGNTADAQDAINAMAEYIDLEDRAADALAAWAPPIQERGTVITW